MTKPHLAETKIRNAIMAGVLRSKRGLNITWRVRDALNRRLEAFQDSIAQRIAPDHRIVSGPFAGMRYPIPKIGSSRVIPKLLGSYEEELHPEIESIIQSNYSDIIDIGCAEGYYAVGLAMRANSARVLAFDTDPLALDAGHRLGQLNGVLDRVTFVKGCSASQLCGLQVGRCIRILLDCEGSEFQLADPRSLPAADVVDLLIECHDSPTIPNMAEELIGRFEGTHQLQIISSRLRDPSNYSILRGWTSGEIEIALSESRPTGMKWLCLRQRNRSART